MLKRAFDLFASALGLLVLSPALVLIAVAIRLDSPGPALFRQERVGRNGIRFRIFKYRTMLNEQKAPVTDITVAGDPRITRIGSYLRAAKLDELPQLLNVIRGDMSLVGPRPEVPRYVALYPSQARELILSLRPGITDEAAIEFTDENQRLAIAENPEQVYVHEILPRKLELYVAYVRSRTFAGDLRILLRTLRKVACG
jgi:lipopolysaccharide/colanic/teichoic acid biosynthesis glycosyltransferase